MALTTVPVTRENRTLAEALQVAPHQIHFIETVRECMEEADETARWHPVCLVHAGTVVGFSMYGMFRYPDGDRLWFDRLLIDQRYQHHGYGREAVQVVLQEMLERYGVRPIYLSVYEDNPIAIALYQSFGFQFIDELDTHGEHVMLRPAMPV